MTASYWVPVASLALAIMVNAALVAFRLGQQSQRITNLEQAAGDRTSMNTTVIELRVKAEHTEAQLTKISATLEGVNRQLGNLAMGRLGVSGELK